jgi:hypothetical protein
MKIGFTGTREGMTARQWRQLAHWIEEAAWPGSEIKEAHHGACVGADSEFVLAVMDKVCCPIHAHPSNIDAMTDRRALDVSEVRNNPLPPLDRNRNIVDAVDVLLAGPKGPEELRSGTWSTVRYARKQGKRVVIFWPDGTTEE